MIQIDMSMPTNCLDCPACNEYLTCAIPINGRAWGENDVGEFDHGRPEWCPLKEQEAVAPVMVPHSRGMTYNCGACGTEIAVIWDTVAAGWAKENVRFCQRCGQAVKWND